MELWVGLSVAAAAAQTVRFMLQRQLSFGDLSATGSTLARFLYSAPLVLGACLAGLVLTGTSVPAMSAAFWGYALVGGITQILATVVVVHLFSLRNFAVGITFKKTEVILTALVGAAVLGDALAPLGWIALGVGLAGVLLLSDPPDLRGSAAGRLFNRAMFLGLLSGVLFAVSAVAYRGATLALEIDSLPLRAGWTLAMVTTSQTCLMLLWLALRDPGQIGKVLKSWRRSGLVGVFSMLGSFCWFAAFSLQTAALVFAVGQIELIFSLLVSVFVFRETIRRREVAGIALLGASIVTVVLVG